MAERRRTSQEDGGIWAATGRTRVAVETRGDQAAERVRSIILLTPAGPDEETTTTGDTDRNNLEGGGRRYARQRGVR